MCADQVEHRRACATLPAAALYTERAVPGEVAERLKALAC